MSESENKLVFNPPRVIGNISYSSLQEYLTFLHGEGSNLKEGCSLEVTDACDLARKRFPGKSFCLVSDWHIVSFEPAMDEMAILNEINILPMAMISNRVVYDSKARFRPGNLVRSTGLVDFIDGIFFQTRNTVYVLMGKGRITREGDTVNPLRSS